MKNMTARTLILKLMQEKEFSVPTRRQILRHMVNSKEDITQRVIKILQSKVGEKETLKRVLIL